MKTKTLLLNLLPVLIMLLPLGLLAQAKTSGTVTLSGYVKDLMNSETLPGAEY